MCYDGDIGPARLRQERPLRRAHYAGPPSRQPLHDAQPPGLLRFNGGWHPWQTEARIMSGFARPRWSTGTFCQRFSSHRGASPRCSPQNGRRASTRWSGLRTHSAASSEKRRGCTFTAMITSLKESGQSRRFTSSFWSNSPLWSNPISRCTSTSRSRSRNGTITATSCSELGGRPEG